MTLLVSLLIIACAIWVGAIVFQSAFVAPVVFTTLDEAGARGFLRAVFPRLFSLGIVCALIMLGCIVVLGSRFGFESWRLVVLLFTLGMLVCGIAARLQVNAINAARDAGPAGKGKFELLHKINVAVVMLVLLQGLAVLAIAPRLMFR